MTTTTMPTCATAAMLPMAQLTLGSASEQPPWVVTSATAVQPAGRSSVTTTPVALFGPLLTTPMTKTVGRPTTALGGPNAVTDRSAVAGEATVWPPGRVPAPASNPALPR